MYNYQSFYMYLYLSVLKFILKVSYDKLSIFDYYLSLNVEIKMFKTIRWILRVKLEILFSN